MRKAIKTIVETIKQRIIEDIKDGGGYVAIKKILAAYNKYQEDECDGVDYIFSLDKKDDLVCCIEGGLTAKQISDMVTNSVENEALKYFHFGQNYDKPHQVKNHKEFFNTLTQNLDVIICWVLTYPNSEGYEDVYRYYITDYMLETNIANKISEEL